MYMSRVDKIDPLAPANFLADKLGMTEPSEILDDIKPDEVARELGLPEPKEVSSDIERRIKRLKR